jgi:hypothetical protein
VYAEVERWVKEEKMGVIQYPTLSTEPGGHLSEEMCTAAANISGQLQAKAIFVYTRTGQSAGFVSRRRPDCPIFAVTGSPPPLYIMCLMYYIHTYVHAACVLACVGCGLFVWELPASWCCCSLHMSLCEQFIRALPHRMNRRLRFILYDFAKIIRTIRRPQTVLRPRTVSKQRASERACEQAACSLLCRSLLSQCVAICLRKTIHLLLMHVRHSDCYYLDRTLTLIAINEHVRSHQRGQRRA